MFVRNPSLTFLLAFKMCALNWIHMGQWHVRDVWFYLRFVLMPVYILQSQSGTFGKHVLVVPWKPNVPKVMCCNILFVLLSIFRHETTMIQRRKSMANGKIIPSFQSWKTKMIPTDLKSISLQEQDSFRSFSRGRRETDRPLMLMVWLMNL